MQDALRAAKEKEDGSKDPVQPGDMITVTYDGQRESKTVDAEGKPQKYHTYTVFVNGKMAGAREAWTW